VPAVVLIVEAAVDDVERTDVVAEAAVEEAVEL
jgi:hypothetical protein